LLVLLSLIGLTLVIAVTYQAVVTAMEQRTYPAPGQLVDVGGHRLHLHCGGEGVPTVILEGGSGEASPMWGWIQPAIAKTTRVCSYDRAGFGWSERGPAPRDADRIVTELHALLGNAGIQPPLVLAGHSFGGELVRLYQHRYPQDVAGMVLVDSGHPDMFSRIPELQEAAVSGDQLSVAAQYAAPLGLMRLYWGEAGPNPDLPPQQSAEMRTFFATAAPYYTQLSENQARAATDAQVRDTGSLGDLPLIVLVAGDDELWDQLQAELAALSSNSQLRVLKDGTHMGFLTSAEQAQQTTDAIIEVVTAARSNQPLAAK
jgi:pimeloyl-ACP methyl ester carboxylesterase